MHEALTLLRPLGEFRSPVLLVAFRGWSDPTGSAATTLRKRRQGRGHWRGARLGYWRDVDTALDLSEGRVRLLAQRAAAVAKGAGRLVPHEQYAGAGRALGGQRAPGAYPASPA